MPIQVSDRILLSERMRRCTLDECHAACCVHGVWIDTTEIQDVLQHSALIKPHLPPERQDPALWFDGREETDEHALSGWVGHTTVLPDPNHYGGSACIFLRQDYKCALQVAADASGFPSWRFKPFYCILHPLDLDEQGQISLDETDLLLEEPASCLRPADHPIPLVETFEPELRYFLGDKDFKALCERIKPAPDPF